MNGKGCKLCADDLRRKSHDDFVKDANLVHSNKYTYNIPYTNRRTKIMIHCKKHGGFEQTPNAHVSHKNGCPRCSMAKFSRKQIEWLTFLETYYNISIRHMGNSEKEYTIRSTRWLADGYCKENHTIYEYHGSYWHGDPKLFDKDDWNAVCKRKMGYLYEKTIARENRVRELGYNLVVMWESDWDSIQRSIRKLQRIFRQSKPSNLDFEKNQYYI